MLQISPSLPCPHVPTAFPSVALSPSSISYFSAPFLFSLTLFPLFYFLPPCPIPLYSVSHSASFITDCLPYFSIYCLLTMFSFILPACLSFYKTTLSLFFPIPLFSVSLSASSFGYKVILRYSVSLSASSITLSAFPILHYLPPYPIPLCSVSL